MAVVHHTTLTPGKLELLAAWLPTRIWYHGPDRPPLVKSGGFRLDDPAGEVGLEFLVVTDTSGDSPGPYLVPLTYRGAPLEGAEHALVGTMEHGVLGRRWAYDGVHDPVLVAQSLALLEGRAQAQDQNLSDTPDREVRRSFAGYGRTPRGAAPDCPRPVREDHFGTAVPAPQGTELRFCRQLHSDDSTPADHGGTPRGLIEGGWTLPDGTRERGRFATLVEVPAPGPRPATGR